MAPALRPSAPIAPHSGPPDSGPSLSRHFNSFDFPRVVLAYARAGTGAAFRQSERGPDFHILGNRFSRATKHDSEFSIQRATLHG